MPEAHDPGSGPAAASPWPGVGRLQGGQLGTGNTQYNFFAGRGPPRWPHRVGVVPDPADCFQHRPVADQVDAVLAAGETTILTQVLTGLGGVGKTQIAAQVADRAWQRRSLDLLVWVTAASVDAVVSGYAQAGADVTATATGEATADARRFLAWLAGTDRSWLIVLDDLADPATLTGWWPPHTPTGRTIVTTRRRDAALTRTGRRLIDVDLYTPDEARAYLADRLAEHPTLHDDGDTELVEDLGRLPLALAQASAYLIDRRITVTAYRRRWADRHRQLVDLVPDRRALPDQHRDTLSTTWSLSIDAADALTPAGLARPLLQLLSLLDPNGIPESILTTAATLGHLADTRRPHGASGSTITAEQVRDALTILYRLNLAAAVDNSARTVRVHALVQRATRDQSTLDEITVAARAGADALLQAWPGIEHDPTIGQILRANAGSLIGHAEDDLWTPEAHAVLFRAGESLGDSGQLTAARDYFHHLDAAAVQRLGPDHRHRLKIRSNKIVWRGKAGDPAGAAAAAEELLADRIRVLGPDHPDTLDTRHDVVFWRGHLGNPAATLAAFEQLLPEFIRQLGPDHEDTLNVRTNIATWRGYIGDAAGAVADLERLLPDRIRVLGRDHFYTLVTRHDIAFWRGQAGEVAWMATDLAELMSEYLRVLGPDHPDTLIIRKNIAVSHGRLGDSSGAATALQILLTDYIRILGPNHPDTLHTRGNLAYWQGQAGDRAEALQAFDQLCTDYIRVLGPDHPDTLKTRYDLAAWTGSAGDPAGAAAALEELLADYLRILGPHHPDTLATRQELEYWQGYTTQSPDVMKERGLRSS